MGTWRISTLRPRVTLRHFTRLRLGDGYTAWNQCEPASTGETCGVGLGQAVFYSIRMSDFYSFARSNGESNTIYPSTSGNRNLLIHSSMRRQLN